MAGETTSKVWLVAHNLGLGTFVSGTEDKDLVLRTLGEGVAFLIEHPEKQGKVTVSFKDDEKDAITVFELKSLQGSRLGKEVGIEVTRLP
jgi:hypothetical protein